MFIIVIMKTKKILLELPEETHRRLKVVAAEQESSIKETLLQLINNFTNKYYDRKNQ